MSKSGALHHKRICHLITLISLVLLVLVFAVPLSNNTTSDTIYSYSEIDINNDNDQLQDNSMRERKSESKNNLNIMEQDQIDHEQYSINQTIEKNQSRPSFLMILGIEGSGHHLWSSIFSQRRINKRNDNENIIILKNFKALSNCIFQHKYLRARRIEQDCREVKIRLTEIKARKKNMKILMTQRPYSFPGLKGAWPHLLKLFHVLESLDFKTKFIVMQRSIPDCLYSLAHRFVINGKYHYNATKTFNIMLQKMDDIFIGLGKIEDILINIVNGSDDYDWIKVDYHELTKYKLRYIDVVSDFLNMDSVKVTSYFDHILYRESKPIWQKLEGLEIMRNITLGSFQAALEPMITNHEFKIFYT